MQTNLHASSRWDAANSSEGLALRPAKDKRHRPPEQLPRCELLAPAQATPQKAALRAAGGSKHRPSRNGLSTGQRFHDWHAPQRRTIETPTAPVHSPCYGADPWEPAAGQRWHCMQNQCSPASNAGPYEPVNSLARPCRPPCGEDCHIEAGSRASRTYGQVTD